MKISVKRKFAHTIFLRKTQLGMIPPSGPSHSDCHNPSGVFAYIGLTNHAAPFVIKWKPIAAAIEPTTMTPAFPSCSDFPMKYVAKNAAPVTNSTPGVR